MSSCPSSRTASPNIKEDLNQARIQGDDTLTLFMDSTQSKSKREGKILLSQEDSFDYRDSISQILKDLEQQQNLATPQAKKHHRKKVDLTKTMTIKGKKGKLYQQICPICLAQYEFPTGTLHCKHKFCFNCIQIWSKTSTNCPCCRKNFDKIMKKDQQNAIEHIKVQQKMMQFKQEDYFICYVCGSGDHENVLLICDMCDFYCCHIYCDPQLNNMIPEGDWFCRNCQRQTHSHNETASLVTDTYRETQEEEDKPVAARTRSRNLNTSVDILRRMRRRTRR